MLRKLKTRWYSSYLNMIPNITRFLNTDPKQIETVDTTFSIYESTEDPYKRPPLVLFHALMGSRYHWDSIAKAINTSTGRKIITVDARNHGESPHSPEHTYIHTAHDAKDLFKKLDIPKASILGHSMGGLTVMTMALLFPELISSLLVVEVSPIKTALQLSFVLSLLDAMASMPFNAGIDTEKARKLADERLKTVTPDNKVRNYLIMNLINTNTGAHTWRVNIPVLKKNFEEHIYKFPSSLKGLQYHGPTVFIAGSLSNYIDPEDMPKIREYFPSANTVYVEGAKHWVQLERPELFIKRVCDFLDDNEC